MAEPTLNASGVVGGIGEGVAATRPEPLARVDDIALVQMPTDETGPRQINAYSIELKNFDAIDGKKFKIVPERLLYSLQWKHNGTSPDLHLQLEKEPALWFDFVATMLLGALSKHDPNLRYRLRAAAAA